MTFCSKNSHQKTGNSSMACAMKTQLLPYWLYRSGYVKELKKHPLHWEKFCLRQIAAIQKWKKKRAKKRKYSPGTGNFKSLFKVSIYIRIVCDNLCFKLKWVYNT